MLLTTAFINADGTVAVVVIIRRLVGQYHLTIGAFVIGCRHSIQTVVFSAGWSPQRLQEERIILLPPSRPRAQGRHRSGRN
jgi:hypothetical protein